MSTLTYNKIINGNRVSQKTTEYSSIKDLKRDVMKTVSKIQREVESEYPEMHMEIILEGFNRELDEVRRDIISVSFSNIQRTPTRRSAVVDLSPRAEVSNISDEAVTKSDAEEAISIRGVDVQQYVRGINYKRFNVNTLEYLASIISVPGRTSIIKGLKGDEKKLVLYNAILNM